MCQIYWECLGIALGAKEIEMNFRMLATWVILGLLFLLPGCGGSNGQGGTNLMSMFLTDDLNTGYSSVWVRIHEVELEYAGGSDKVFDSSTGIEVDLRALNAAGTNKFSFLNTANLPTRTYTGAKVTFGRSLTLFPTVGAPRTVSFDPVYDQSNGRSRVQFNFVAPVASSAGGSFVIDFDLANWVEAGGFVTAVIKLHNGSGIDNPANQVDEDWHGTISQLSNDGGGAYSFALNVSASQVLKVGVSASTVVMNSNGQGSPVLANGQFVEVRGKFNRSTGKVDASVVKIEDSSSSGEQKVEGATSVVNAGAGTFDVATSEVRGFLPTEGTVHVTTSGTTRFFADNGLAITKDQFFAAIGSGAAAEVEGTYTSGTNTMAAAKAKLEDHSGSDFYDEAKGGVTTFNTTAATLSVQVTEWEGFAFTLGGVLPITTTGSTSYRDSSGSSMNQTQFFSALVLNSSVKVEGTFANGSMTAKRLEFRSSGSGGGGGQHEAKGYVSSPNVGAGTFTLDLFSWFGFGGSFGMDMNVTMLSTATYRDGDGNPVTKEQFFALLVAGSAAEVEGTATGTNFSGVKAKIED